MLNLHLFLAHAISDYSFTNPMKMYGNKEFAFRLKHFLWMALVFLAFTFDSVLFSAIGIFAFILSLGLHTFVDFLRYRKLNKWLVEGISIGGFLVLAVIFSQLFAGSFVSPYFSNYLIGMILVSVIPTQIFRMLKLIDPLENESDGISERIAMYIFVFGGAVWYALIAAACAVIYRLIFRKKFNWTWIISPVLGIIVPLIFRLIIL